MRTTGEIQGWFGDYHKKGYNFLINNTPEGGTFVEIGAWLGRSSTYLVDNSENLDIIIIDSWLGSPNELETNHKLATQVDIYEIFKHNMGDRKYKSIRGLSNEVFTQFADNSIDTLFLDATHTFEAVIEDITNWLPKIKPGGFIAGDDYMEQWEGVIKAVDKILPDRKLLQSIWYYQKPVV